MNQIPPHYLTHELTHKYGGNGLFFVRHVDDSYIQCCWVDAKQKPKEMKTVRDDMVSKFTMPAVDQKTGAKTTVDYPIHPDLQTELASLRDDLESGKRVIKNGFIVKP